MSDFAGARFALSGEALLRHVWSNVNKKNMQMQNKFIIVIFCFDVLFENKRKPKTNLELDFFFPMTHRVSNLLFVLLLFSNRILNSL